MGYETLRRWAEQLDLDEAMGLFDATLADEKNTDEALTELADSMINERAVAAEQAQAVERPDLVQKPSSRWPYPRRNVGGLKAGQR
jgi:thioredoxin-like negative regulator of GroEL